MKLSFIDRLVVPGKMDSGVKGCLCRDLSDLLNTRRAEQDFDIAFEEAGNSLLTFGIPDFTSYNLKNTADQERIRISIERAIRQFEPRLARVKVFLAENTPADPVLRFEITAQLRDGGTGEDMVFDATLHRGSRRIAFDGED